MNAYQDRLQSAATGADLAELTSADSDRPERSLRFQPEPPAGSFVSFFRRASFASIVAAALGVSVAVGQILAGAGRQTRTSSILWVELDNYLAPFVSPGVV